MLDQEVEPYYLTYEPGWQKEYTGPCFPMFLDQLGFENGIENGTPDPMALRDAFLKDLAEHVRERKLNRLCRSDDESLFNKMVLEFLERFGPVY